MMNYLPVDVMSSLCGAVIAVDDLLDWAACDEAIDAGYRHAIEKLGALDEMALGGPW